MSSALRSLIDCGTKLWLDSIDPELVKKNRAFGATGATSNPIIISDLIRTGRFDADLADRIKHGLDDNAICWEMTDKLVKEAQAVFLPVWQDTRGNDGYVSFELDPLLEDPQTGPPQAARVARYVELGKKWAAGHKNRMIKVPATPAGLAALEDLAAAGVTLNVTLIFTDRQYKAAREAVWRGAQRRPDLTHFKSVYSIFVSRVDVYTDEHCRELSPQAQGLVGIVNVKKLWHENQAFWKDKGLALQQEIIFASTGTKKKEDPPDKYVEALAGSDIQTNPPGTNDAVEKLGRMYTRRVDQMPADGIVREIEQKVAPEKLEEVLMREGVDKFVKPQKALLATIKEKRTTLAPGH
jgi:transaldolase